MERIQRDTHTLSGDPVRLVFTRESETTKEYNSTLNIWTENSRIELDFDNGKAATECYKALTNARVRVEAMYHSPEGEPERVTVSEEKG